MRICIPYLGYHKDPTYHPSSAPVCYVAAVTYLQHEAAITHDLQGEISVSFLQFTYIFWGFPGSSVVKNLLASAGDCKRWEFDAWVRKNAWRKNGNPRQYSFLENSMDRRAW